MKYFIHTYGCQMNYSDTERIETYLEALGYEKSDTELKADIIIFNTCSVKQKAEDKVLGYMQKMKKLKKKRPDIVVVITGCMVRKSSTRYSEQRDKLFNRSPEIDIALRIEDLPLFASLIREHKPEITKIKEENIKDYFKIVPSHTSAYQAFIPISTGCDKFCTYCIVPFSRGREKSRPIEEIIKEVKDVLKKGCKEITLIGQTVDSYGLSAYDKKKGLFKKIPKGEVPFVYLLKKIDKLYDKGLRRLRFTSPHPRDVSDDLIEAIASLKTLMPYIHLPVQAGHNDTLKRMNRPYTVGEYKEIIYKLRKQIPNIAISTDIIVGFCGETEKEFQASYDFYKELEFDFAYISKYSNRPGTFADKNLKDNVSYETKKKRWQKLNRLLKQISKKKLKTYIGKEVKVLVETQENGLCTGKNEHFKTVQFKSKKDLIGRIVKVKITDSKDWVLIRKQS